LLITKKNNINFLTIAIIVCLAVILGLSAALVITLRTLDNTETLDLSPLQQLAQTIESEYYYYDDKALNGGELVDAAMRGMVTKLDDPYAQYFTEEEYKKLLSDNSGDYKGIGINVQVPDENGAKIITVFSGSPAEQAGLRKGDVIIRVNGSITANLSLDELVALFSTDDAVPDEITYLRDGMEKSVTVLRSEVHVTRVVSEVLEGGIGYIRITEFNGSVAEDFAGALQAMLDQGVGNLIIDLRDNPGGGLTEVLSVADMLLPQGKTIVSIRSKNGEERVYTSSEDARFHGNLAVLVNGYSASASELLTGALKDYGLATVVGTQTFGKGIVQSFFHLSGDNGWVKMTTDAYFTPNGVCIQDVGIAPDIEVDLPEDLQNIAIEFLDPSQDTQLQTAVKLFAQQAELPSAKR
jgi:carboxyl-terminal processing protease